MSLLQDSGTELLRIPNAAELDFLYAGPIDVDTLRRTGARGRAQPYANFDQFPGEVLERCQRAEMATYDHYVSPNANMQRAFRSSGRFTVGGPLRADELAALHWNVKGLCSDGGEFAFGSYIHRELERYHRPPPSRPARFSDIPYLIGTAIIINYARLAGYRPMRPQPREGRLNATRIVEVDQHGFAVCDGNPRRFGGLVDFECQPYEENAEARFRLVWAGG